MIQEVVDDTLLRLEAGPSKEDFLVRRAKVREALGTLTEIQLEIYTVQTPPPLGDLVGEDFFFSVLDPAGIGSSAEPVRTFGGLCISAKRLGYVSGAWHYQLQLRPKLWRLTRRWDHRYYQEMAADAIIDDILGFHGLSGGSVVKRLTATYPTRTYCVQYAETDFDFITRLMQQEGIYYFFEYPVGGTEEKLVLVDDSSRHQPCLDEPIKFVDKFSNYEGQEEHVQEWQAAEEITTGEVNIDDYDFEAPKSSLLSKKKDLKGNHNHKDLIDYRTPGQFIASDAGELRVKVRAEAHSHKHRICRGIANARGLATGSNFTMEKHPVGANNREYTIISNEYWIQAAGEEYSQDQGKLELTGQIEFDDENFTGRFQCNMRILPNDVQFRSDRDVPWPQIPGYLTAKVVGPDPAKEIYTDEYGRVKVLFNWDRQSSEAKSQRDPNTNSSPGTASCWIRVVTPWSGNNWGFIAIPRIDQEVIVQFEDGDPDRPMVTGMLYNADTMPPYALPDNMTQQGIKTNTVTGGGGFNELMMEDKKDNELVRFQSEKDYEQIVKNNATITIGLEKTDPGDLTQTIHNDVTETIGNDETREIGNDVSETIGNDESREIGNDRSETIGNDESVEIGNDQSIDVGMNQSITVGVNQTVEAGTNIELTANATIKLTCGGSEIEMTPASIKISSPLIQIDGSGMTEVKGGGMVKIQGGITMIN